MQPQMDLKMYLAKTAKPTFLTIKHAFKKKKDFKSHVFSFSSLLTSGAVQFFGEDVFSDIIYSVQKHLGLYPCGTFPKVMKPELF